ncbi:putative atp-dependent rna helicase suv3 [Diaporthe ampelina]|uniref:RNA helicase n=1 Tax=Diaporthe ampelina TaxID=1214573 RepID=A0A0G2FHK6_9PEZI|nr:putative atp-dependent rna helicase suv3 [Diaporthe ampelina]
MIQNDHFKDLKLLGIKPREDLTKEAHLFRNVIEKSLDLATRLGRTGRQENPFFWSWRNAFVAGDITGLSNELRYSFTSFIVRQQLPEDAIACHEKIADFRNPHEWFPATRAMQRKIHLHVGPTNSGKTYHALKALEEAKTGVYAGPLRLLAHEVFTRFEAKGRRCALITGEEQRIPEGDEGYFASCTVEMTPLNQRVDVAVIDEIQMIGDDLRGWAWTQALLGVQAKELHLCGEERTVPLIKDICAKIGDEVVVHRYKRLSGLQPMQESLQGRFENLRKGDAVVSFSRLNLHTLKAGIEKATGKKCAIVYGSLPPESRAQQAALFNDPDNDYDYLAASDAIGMGLNLEIKRVVFEAVAKHDGTKVRTLTLPELKQIGGRAGRYRTVAQAAQTPTATSTSPVSSEDLTFKPKAPTPKMGQVGLVTTLEDVDLKVVQGSFKGEAEPLKTAGLFPPSFVIERFSSYFPAGTPFSFILLRLRDIARLPPQYHMANLRDNIVVANHIQSIPLSVYDRSIFLNAPISLKDPGMKEFLRSLATRVANHDSGKLLDFKELNLELLDYTRTSYPAGRVEYLKHLEALHKFLTLYLWLSYRYVGVFQSQALAFHVKAMVEERINEYLANLDYSPEVRRVRVEQMRMEAAKKSRAARQVFDEDEEPQPEQQQQRVGDWTAEGHEEPLFNGLGEAEKIPGTREVTP